VILGELNKWTPVSTGRVKSISSTPTSVSIALAGEYNEKVSFSFVNNNVMPLAAITFSCIIPTTGRITLTVPSGVCM